MGAERWDDSSFLAQPVQAFFLVTKMRFGGDDGADLGKVRCCQS